jgi:hypothetical protein
MSEKETIDIMSVQIDLNDKKSTKLLTQTLIELKNKGYFRVTLDIKTSTEQELKKSGLDIEVFNKIKEMQDIPEWVVINFMLAVGKLKGSQFKLHSIDE